MVKTQKVAQVYQLYACLPFVELAHESFIQLGPAIFWPASKADTFLSDSATFQSYMQSVAQIKAKNQEQEEQPFHTRTLALKGTTCISLADNIQPELKEFLLIDSLYLLYFACTFRSLYYGHEIPSFNAFRKMIPASFDFIQSKQNWENLYIQENNCEETICLHLVDPEICRGLGKALEKIYVFSPVEEDESIQTDKRLVRSIRYLVDRFFQRFVNLFGKGLHFSGEIFEPEDVIFLASSFETLFNLDSQQPAADFKYKLRSLLHLKHSSSMEIFWKWVDDFYEVRRRILHGDTFLNPLFRQNPNFEISHILLGIKLFVYSVYHHLFTSQLLKPKHADLFNPPDFHWVHPQEVLLFFWTESALLRKLALFTKNVENKIVNEEMLSDFHLYSSLFVSFYERYYFHHQLKGDGIVRFIPTPTAELSASGGDYILETFKASKTLNETLSPVLHPKFLHALESRLQG